jgi:hypothetical protein
MEYIWKGKVANITRQLLVDNDIDPQQEVFELRGAMYRALGWEKESDTLTCRVLEER